MSRLTASVQRLPGGLALSNLPACEIIRMAAIDFAFLLRMYERVTLDAHAERIASIYDRANPRTAAVLNALRDAAA